MAKLALRQADKISRAAGVVRSRSAALEPSVGLVLGSGLGRYAERLVSAVRIPYAELPHFPRATVSGHAGNLWIGRHEGMAVAVLQGRVHLYEGHAPSDVVFGVRVLAALGVKVLCVTNAAGGIRSDLEPGDLMRISDQLNLTSQNPLVGPNDDRQGPRFPDLSAAYDPELGARLDALAREAGLRLPVGVYAQLLGPSYETPAEVRMLHILGADAVGMSTALEVIAARHLGVRVAGLSCITNRAAGLSERPLAHAEVADVAARAEGGLGRLLDGLLASLAAGGDPAPPQATLSPTPGSRAALSPDR